MQELMSHPPETIHFIVDKELSLKGRGLLLMFFSMNESAFPITSQYLVHFCKDGQSSVLSGLRELKELGYLDTQRQRNKQGQFETKLVFKFYRMP